MFALAPVSAKRSASGSPSGKRELPSWLTGARKPCPRHGHLDDELPRAAVSGGVGRLAVDGRRAEREQRPRRRVALHLGAGIDVVGRGDRVVDARAALAGRDRRHHRRQLQHRRRRVAHLDGEGFDRRLVAVPIDRTEHLTSVLPSGKNEPDGGLQIGVTGPSTTSLAQVAKLTIAPAPELVPTLMSFSGHSVGGVVSTTRTGNVASAVWPRRSLATQLTVAISIEREQRGRRRRAVDGNGPVDRIGGRNVVADKRPVLAGRLGGDAAGRNLDDGRTVDDGDRELATPTAPVTGSAAVHSTASGRARTGNPTADHMRRAPPRRRSRAPP